jgi:hypothetical protein
MSTAKCVTAKQSWWIIITEGALLRLQLLPRLGDGVWPDEHRLAGPILRASREAEHKLCGRDGDILALDIDCGIIAEVNAPPLLESAHEIDEVISGTCLARAVNGCRCA